MFALVTGASSGIGLQYATALARDYRCDLLLVSNQEKELQQVAMNLTQQYGVKTMWLYKNLAEQNAAEQIYQYTQDNNIQVDVLINNAGMLIFNPLCQTPIGKVETMVNLHVLTLTKLCRLYAQDMVSRTAHASYTHKPKATGFILNMSSMTAWMAMPGIQAYNATKGFVLNFSKSLWYELRPYGVHVIALTPGSTDTGLLPFPPHFAKLLRFAGITMSPEKLVNKALKALFKTWKKQCMPGAWNAIIVPIINHLPDWLVFAVMKRFPLFELKQK